MLKISYCNHGPEIKQKTGDWPLNSFEELATIFELPKKANKDQGYWVRGLLTRYREDADMQDSRLLVIDGDVGGDGGNAPEPKAVHEALKQMNLNHFIHVTHSHSATVNKFRCVVLCDRPYTRKDLKANNKKLIRKLSQNGVSIKHVREMNSMSQAWYMANRDDPDDGLWEFYSKFDGYSWEVIEGEEAEEQPEGDKSSGESLDDLYANIVTGKEYHTSMRTVIYQWVKDGVSKPNAKAQMRSLMNLVQDKGDRWQKRWDEIDGLVDGVQDEEEIEIDVPPDSAGKHSPPIMPGGMLGKFIKETKEFMMFQDDTLAFIAGCFIGTSICGRAFNVDIRNKDGLAHPTALNMYFTLAAETGVGKSEIENAVEKCYSQFSASDGSIQDFFYKGRLSGPKALYRLVSAQRSIGIITNEAGIDGQSKLGDVQGMRGAWLNIYGQGAWNKWTGASEFSDADSSIKNLRAVALSRVSESTPVELTKYYRAGDNVENGLIPRECIFVLKRMQVEINENPRLAYSSDVIAKIEGLVKTCKEASGEGIFKPHIITVDLDTNSVTMQDMVDTQRKYRALQQDSESVYIRAMSSRAFVKMLRYAGLHTVFNKPKGDPRALVIDNDAWSWAKRVVEDELEKIGDVVAISSNNSDVDAAVNHTCIKIGQMLSGTCGNADGKLGEDYVKARIVPLGKIRKVCKGNSVYKHIEGDPKHSSKFKSGLDKALDVMADDGLIEWLVTNPLAKRQGGKTLKVTPYFGDYLRELNLKS